MKRFIKLIAFVFSLLSFFVITTNKVSAATYLADKAEIPITLNNTGARAICQTDDGFVWIGQFAGLNRYDSKELLSFNSFTDENGEKEILENVRCLAHFRNKLFLVSSIGLLKYEDNTFSKIKLELNMDPLINDIVMDDYGLLYISTKDGLYTYNTTNSQITYVSEFRGSQIKQTTIYKDSFFVLKDNGVYDHNNTQIYESGIINSFYCYNDTISIATKDGKIYFYDIKSSTLQEDVITLSEKNDMVHKFIYSYKDKDLFAACEKGLYSIDITTYKATYAKNLENSSKLVDLMIDYENNLWIASYITGVSIITKSTLVDLLFDVDTKTIPESSRLVYAIEKYGKYLYLATGGGIYVYDLEEEKIDTAHPLVTQINEIINYDKEQVDDWQRRKDENARQKEIDPSTPDFTEPRPDTRIPYYDVRDVTIYKDKLYFATYGSGLFEYDPSTEVFRQYRGSDINPDDPTVNTKGYYVAAQRCLYATDEYLFIGTSTNSIVRFNIDEADPTKKFIWNNELTTTGQILYIDKSAFGELTYVASSNGIHTINYNLDNSSIKPIPGIDQNTSGMLKFYQDGDDFFYNIYGRFFVINTKDNNYSDPKEINIPYVNGSITEINKIKVTEDGKEKYKYILASEKQIYVIDDLLADTLDYSFYDSSNGLKSSIKGNSSGYYDAENKIYYFQSQDGVYSYDFNDADDKRVPLKVAVGSVKVDDELMYGNKIKVDKSTERIMFNVSVFSFKPTKGYKVYYKLDGVDKRLIEADSKLTSVNYTNLKGGKYTFHIYVLDELDQISNQIDITVIKTKHIYEHPWFVIMIILLALFVIVGVLVYYFKRKINQSIRRQLEYKKITLESIEAIARTIDVKDSYTNGHSRRVGYYSREIAKAMGLDEKQVENIFYTALLHDIGKIGIPISIINKPSRLDDNEFSIMKTHTSKGGKILKDISTIPGIVEGAMYHHERYDGTGYPKGLKGEEIPLIARIICCADCFDAMATKRSYKEPCTKDYIINEFKRCSGTQFDPEIAKIMVKLIEEDKFKTIMEEDLKHKNDDVITIEDSKDGE